MFVCYYRQSEAVDCRSYLENQLYFLYLSSEESSSDLKYTNVNGCDLKTDIPESKQQDT